MPIQQPESHDIAVAGHAYTWEWFKGILRINDCETEIVRTSWKRMPTDNEVRIAIVGHDAGYRRGTLYGSQTRAREIRASLGIHDA